ncbi:MAG: hypothetical protein V2A73_08620 [Pseudomonadota bacterium]
MGKPKPRRIASDDCEVTLDGGEKCTPHEGEWVEIFTGWSVGELKARNEFNRMRVRLDAVEGESDEARRSLAIMDESFEGILAALAGRIVTWNWTDLAGRQLPQPDGTKEPLRQLHADELFWLLNAGAGETPSERKNG